MKVDKKDYSSAVVAINAMARELQKQAAKPFNDAALYKIATDIMFECQDIRQQTAQEPKTLKDYIKRIFK